MSSLSNNAKPWTTKLSSAGLIYHHYGERVLSLITGKHINLSVTYYFYYLYWIKIFKFS